VWARIVLRKDFVKALTTTSSSRKSDGQQDRDIDGHGTHGTWLMLQVAPHAKI
jgi:hypothetical protein